MTQTLQPTTTTIKLSPHLTAKRHSNQFWYLSVPTVNGRSRTVSTGLNGNAFELRRFVRDHKLREAAETAAHTKSATAVLDVMLTGRKIDWESLLKEWTQSLTVNGKSSTTIARQVGNMTRLIRDMKLADKSPRAVTAQDIFQWVNPDEPITYLTRIVRLQAPRSFFKFTQGAGYMINDPSISVEVVKDLLSHKQKEPRPVKAFTKESFKELVAGIKADIATMKEQLIDNPYQGSRRISRRRNLKRRIDYARFWYSAVHLSYALGLRISDICQLEWDSLADPDRIIIHTEKTNVRIAIPISQASIANFLKAIPAERRDMTDSALNQIMPILDEGIRSLADLNEKDHRFIFPTQQKDYKSLRSKPSVYFSRLSERHGLQGFSFHSLRHARIRQWKANGLSLEMIGHFVGHSSTKTTEKYLG